MVGLLFTCHGTACTPTLTLPCPSSWRVACCLFTLQNEAPSRSAGPEHARARGGELRARARSAFAETCAAHGLALRSRGPATRSIRPYFVHVPKCGSAFATVMVQTHCPWFVLKTPVVDTRHFSDNDACNAHFLRLKNGHEGLTTVQARKVGVSAAAQGNADRRENMVSMLRHPTARLVSGLFHDFHDCLKFDGRGQPKLDYTPDDPRVALLVEARRKVELNRSYWHEVVADVAVVGAYAACVRGLSTKMYVGHRAERSQFFNATPADVAAAVQVVNGAGFIGITELFNLSVCLYAAKFQDGRSNITSMSFAKGRVHGEKESYAHHKLDGQRDALRNRLRAAQNPWVGRTLAEANKKAQRAAAERTSLEAKLRLTLFKLGWKDAAEMEVYKAALRRVLFEVCKTQAPGEPLHLQQGVAWCARLSKPLDVDVQVDDSRGDPSRILRAIAGEA